MAHVSRAASSSNRSEKSSPSMRRVVSAPSVGPRPGGQHSNKEVSECVFVGVRLRPPSERDSGKTKAPNIYGNTITVEGGGRPRKYEFDCVLDSSNPNSAKCASQVDVYAHFGQRMVDHVLDGFTSTLFAYGQTGSGKTTTMLGNLQHSSQHGILPRQLTAVFEKATSLRRRGTDIKFTVQMLQVYNEMLSDLLSTAKFLDGAKTRPKVHVHPKVGMFVTDATDAAVESYGETLSLLEYGSSRRAVAATGMNRESSRGHTVFRLHIEQSPVGSAGVISSALYCVDLAGRENERTTSVKGMQLVELGHINKSLMFLSGCIKSLGARCSARGGQRAGETSMFRNSKLTMLLANALSGNSRTALIAAIHPAIDHVAETVTTLNFAATAKNIQVTSRSASVVDKDLLLKQLQDEVASLQEQLRTCMDQEQKKRLTYKMEARVKLAEQTNNWDARRRMTVTTLKTCQERLSGMRGELGLSIPEQSEHGSGDGCESVSEEECDSPLYHKDALEKVLSELWDVRASEQQLRAENAELRSALDAGCAKPTDDSAKLLKAQEENAALQSELQSAKAELSALREAISGHSTSRPLNGDIGAVMVQNANPSAPKVSLQEHPSGAHVEFPSLRQASGPEYLTHGATEAGSGKIGVDPLKSIREELYALRSEMHQVWKRGESAAQLLH